ncbi:alpha/beta hydrolase [Pseudogemmatithrix spongiicola]|uniref:Alpha/beta hydrolase n=1 Tax=Pseudogemmatithrix spongiicola TaxID=3062599 RepID=A0AA49Q3P4_9BACT|nr:alpha/beta hydrolase [Gemmatimonadaceae bacterium 'strain 138']WKW13978.1 alpha/beta hydrolase [Gemmatimonadaceae bacterium 'strain 318']
MFRSIVTAALLAATPALHAQEPFRVDVVGNGPPMLLIPGLTNSGEVWRATAAEFAKDHQVHVFSLAGFAGVPPIATDTGWLRMQREAIVAYVRERRLEKPVIVGHSLGGFLALWIAADHPDLPGAVVNIDGMPFFGTLMNPNATRETMRPMAAQMHRMMMSPGARENYMRMQDAQLKMMARDTAAHAMLARHGRDSDMGTMAVAMHDMYVEDLRADLARVRVPVLNVHAWAAYATMGQSREGLERIAANQYASLATQRLRIHDTAYHFIMLDEPAWLHREMREFLASPR